MRFEMNDVRASPMLPFPIFRSLFGTNSSRCRLAHLTPTNHSGIIAKECTFHSIHDVNGSPFQTPRRVNALGSQEAFGSQELAAADRQRKS